MHANQVTLLQAANLVRNIGTTNTVLLKGQPICGKVSLSFIGDDHECRIYYV